jgi:hypothetical protein
MRKVLAILTALPLLSVAAPAQDLEHDWGAWFAFAGQGHFAHGDPDARWRWWFDAHARFLDDSDGFDQSIIRPGIGYDLSKESTLWAGYGWIHTDPNGGTEFDEHRIWQQYTWGRTVQTNTYFSRSRLEQRFVETGDDVGWRFRQFLRLTRPLKSETGIGLRLWDELFFALNDTDWGASSGLDQNRLFAGFGWTIGEAGYYTLEFGYLNQYLNRADDEMNHILAMTLLLNR